MGGVEGCGVGWVSGLSENGRGTAESERTDRAREGW